MGVQIRTIVKDNVATRCDGCLGIIEGTPWRINLLDIVSPEAASSWTARPAINPGPHQFHPDPSPLPARGGRQGLPVLPPVSSSASSCGRSRLPGERRAGACATGSTTSPRIHPRLTCGATDRPPTGETAPSNDEPGVLLPALTSILALVFAVFVLDQWLERRQPIQLVWSLGHALLRARRRLPRRLRSPGAGRSRCTGSGT